MTFQASLHRFGGSLKCHLADNGQVAAVQDSEVTFFLVRILSLLVQMYFVAHEFYSVIRFKMSKKQFPVFLLEAKFLFVSHTVQKIVKTVNRKQAGKFKFYVNKNSKIINARIPLP